MSKSGDNKFGQIQLDLMKGLIRTLLHAGTKTTSKIDPKEIFRRASIEL
jgi:hypothetical protein